MKMAEMLYRLKRLYLKALVFNINIHLGLKLGETLSLLQKFVMLCRTVSESIAYFTTKISDTALYFSDQRLEGTEPREDRQQLQPNPYPAHSISGIR